MARVEGGCCLLSPDVMRLGPLRDDFRPGLPAPSLPLEDFPAAPFCYRLGHFHNPHGLPRAARLSVGRSPPYFVDLYRVDACPCPKVVIASRHRLGFKSLCNPRCKNLLEFFQFKVVNVVVNQTLNP